MAQIKLSFCTPVAYDYAYAYKTIQSYYSLADEILIGLDERNLTWNKKPFIIDRPAFQKRLIDMDPDKKIRIIEGLYHKLSKPIDNDTRERNILKNCCKPGNAVVQIDCDEQLVNPEAFRKWLDETTIPDGAVPYAKLACVYKIIGDTALVVTPATETVQLLTFNREDYTRVRYTTEKSVLSPLWLLHYSWGRTPAELEEKIQSWGHTTDFDTSKYFKFWNSVNLENYQYLRNIHPLGDGSTWQKLHAVKVDFLTHVVTR